MGWASAASADEEAGLRLGAWDPQEAAREGALPRSAWDPASALAPLRGSVRPGESLFPCCLVWVPLPVIGWLVPFVGHVGICRSDGTILDFAGSFFVNVGQMAFGNPVKYLQLSPAQGCFPALGMIGDHTCGVPHAHSEYGTSASWDEALTAVVRRFQHQSYNIFTCNCHSFVACCLNRMALEGRMGWTIVHLGWMMLARGTWVSRWSPLAAFGPFALTMAVGAYAAGWAFILCWLAFAGTLLVWYFLGSCVCTNLIKNY